MRSSLPGHQVLLSLGSQNLFFEQVGPTLPAPSAKSTHTQVMGDVGDELLCVID